MISSTCCYCSLPTHNSSIIRFPADCFHSNRCNFPIPPMHCNIYIYIHHYYYYFVEERGIKILSSIPLLLLCSCVDNFVDRWRSELINQPSLNRTFDGGTVVSKGPRFHQLSQPIGNGIERKVASRGVILARKDFESSKKGREIIEGGGIEWNSMERSKLRRVTDWRGWGGGREIAGWQARAEKNRRREEKTGGLIRQVKESRGEGGRKAERKRKVSGRGPEQKILTPNWERRDFEARKKKFEID